MRNYTDYYETPYAGWFSSLPVTWQTKKMRMLFSERTTKVSDKDYAPLSVGYMGVVPQLESAVKTDNGDDRKLIKAGDFAINSRSDRKGAGGISDYTGSCSMIITVLKPHSAISGKFYHYLLRSHYFSEEFYRNGYGIVDDLWSTKWKSMRNIYLPVPPRDEQDQIVRYLDWKTAAIDRLIRRYQEKVSVLNELKDTVIDHVVIRGRYSPQQEFCTYAHWNLCCPATWEVKRVREMFSFRRGLSITKENLEKEGIPVINYGQIHSKQNSMLGVTDDILRFVSPSYLYSNPSALVQKGDFIFADTSEDREGSGNCAYIDRDGKIFAGYHSIIAHAKDNLPERKYFAYLFRSPTWRHQIRKKVNGVKVYSVTQQILKDAFVVIPPEDEQREIVEYLDNRCYSIDSLIVKMQQKITLLQELKSTLISDVVTGKIDVRDAEIPTNPSME